MNEKDSNTNSFKEENSDFIAEKAIAAQLEEKLAPRRKFKGPMGHLVKTVAVLMGLFQITVLTVWIIDPLVMRAVHLTFISFLGFLLIRSHKNAGEKPLILDWISALLSIAIPIYIVITFDDLIFRSGASPTILDVIFGGIAVILVIELCRRSIGWTLPIISFIFIIYSMVGDYLPGMLWHKGYSPSKLISYLFSGTSIYGLPIAISATYIYLFILFGNILQVSGGGKVFIDIAWSIAGWARGGPAKMSIISSSLFGTVSGGAATNVVVDGYLTIPLMKSVGYGARFSAAVEAVTSTGGQIVPPVMGSGAFLMAEFLGRPYIEIAVAAIIPAILYYISVYVMIDLEAIKRKLKGKPKEQLPVFMSVLLGGWHLLMPIPILIGCLAVFGMSPIRAALWAIGFGIILSWLKSISRIGLKKLLNALEDSAKGMIEIAVTCAMAGIIIGMLTLTGLGLKFASLLLAMSGGNLIVGLLLCMVTTIILGMGMPTVAAYVVAAAVIAPGLEALGAPKLSAHMFVFYFACLSALTPPVALAAYAAAAIARTNTFEVALNACRLVIAGFIIPYAFVYSPGLLMQGSISTVALNTLTALVGVVGLAMAIQGWALRKMSLPARLLVGGFSLLSIDPNPTTDLVGVCGVAIMIAGQFLNRMLSQKKGKLLT